MRLSLRVERLSCTYGKTNVVDQVTFAIGPGEHVALVGTNGCGKSTLLRSVLGLHSRTSGVIEVDGVAVVSRRQHTLVRQRAAWMPQRQSVGHFPLLVRELLASSRDEAAANVAAEDLGIGILRDRPLHTLSGGQLQRAYLSRALGSLARDAGLLLADEPTAALDFSGQERVANLLRDVAATVLVVTHDMAVARKCDRVLEMAAGRIREAA